MRIDNSNVMGEGGDAMVDSLYIQFLLGEKVSLIIQSNDYSKSFESLFTVKLLFMRRIVSISILSTNLDLVCFLFTCLELS